MGSARAWRGFLAGTVLAGAGVVGREPELFDFVGVADGRVDP